MSGEDWPTTAPADDEVDLGYEDGEDPDHFAMIMSYVLDFPGLSRVAKDAYICLKHGLGFGKRQRRATRAQLAAVMSISVDTFERGLKELEAKGIVEVIRTRDMSTGNWNLSRYLIKDTKGSRYRARILQLEQELGNAKAKKDASSQVGATPQSAVRTDGQEPPKSGSDQTADCGVDATSGNTASSQVGTTPQLAVPPCRNLRCRGTASCGHIRKSSSKKEGEEKERDQKTPAGAVGEIPTVRTARGIATDATAGAPLAALASLHAILDAEIARELSERTGLDITPAYTGWVRDQLLAQAPDDIGNLALWILGQIRAAKDIRVFLTPGLSAAYTARQRKPSPAPASKPKLQSVPLPDDFRLSDGMRRWAAATYPGIDVDAETTAFVYDRRAKGLRRVDWYAEWQKWIAGARAQQPGPAASPTLTGAVVALPGSAPTGQPRYRSTGDQRFAEIQALKALYPNEGTG